MSNQEPETFHPGDHIQAIGSLNHLESIQPVSTNMKLLHHRIGEVEEINQGMVVAAFPRPGPGPTGEPPHRFEFNPAAIRHVQPLGPGRTVVFAVLKSHLHRLEPERASRAMHPYLGRAGMIEDVLSATEYRVRFGPGEDAVLVLSPCSLIVGEGLERLADFEIGTHVRIIRDHAEFQRVQSLLGEWTTDYWNLAGCEGIVVGFVLGFLNVSIPSLGLKVRLSPLALEPQGHTNPEEQVTVRTHAHALVRSDGHPDGECTACGQAWTDEVVWTCGKDSCWILMCSTCVEAYQSDQPRPETGRPVVVSVGASKDDKADAKESGFAGLEGFELSRSRKLGSLVLFHNGRVQRSLIFTHGPYPLPVHLSFRIPTEKLKPSKPMTTGDTVHFCDNHSLPTALGPPYYSSMHTLTRTFFCHAHPPPSR